MKVGDDAGKVYRKRFLNHDPIAERTNRLGNWALLLLCIYLFGHIAYALYN